MMDSLMGYFDVFLLVFARMGGMLLANPLLSRKNVPMRVRVGLVLALSLLLAPNLDAQAAAGFQTVEMMMALFKEAALGVCFGLVFQIFYYMIFVAGDVMDTVFGLSMAKVFDPVSGTQVSVMGQLLQIVFVLYFFATGSHLVMIKTFAYSFDVIPPGAYTLLLEEISSFLLTLFNSAFLLMLKMSLPFIIAEFIVEAAMGILMKLIPQIHVFVINMQCKIIAGLLLVLLFAQPIGNFIDNYIGVILDNMQKLLTVAV